jgi:hypothetical protein
MNRKRGRKEGRGGEVRAKEGRKKNLYSSESLLLASLSLAAPREVHTLAAHHVRPYDCSAPAVGRKQPLVMPRVRKREEREENRKENRRELKGRNKIEIWGSPGHAGWCAR